MSKNFSVVHLEFHESIAILTIDRPPVNALNAQGHREIFSALEDIERAEARCVVLAAAGAEEGRPFSAGSDISEFEGLDAEASLTIAEEARIHVARFFAFPIPIISAVEGLALGGGLAYILCSDVRVFSRNAKVGMPEIKVGALGGGKMLMRLVGPGRARELIYTGEIIGSEEAFRVGIADHLVEPGQAKEKALGIAKRISMNSPVGVRLAKRQMIEVEKLDDLDEAYALETRLTAEYRDSPDAAEAVRAFLEKRKPIF
jgi:enoyl-CoA hydratase